MALNTNLLLPDPVLSMALPSEGTMALLGNQTRISHFILWASSHTHHCTSSSSPLSWSCFWWPSLWQRAHDPPHQHWLRLHSPMYFFLSWLSLMDLMLISTIVPHMAIDYLLGHGSISFTGCGLQILFFLTLLGDECFLLAFMAYDRYVAISNPLRYSVVMSSPCLLAHGGRILALWPCGWADPDILHYDSLTVAPKRLTTSSVRSLQCSSWPVLMPPSMRLWSMCAVSSCCSCPSLSSLPHIWGSDNCAPHAFCWRSAEAFATCSSHMAAVSLFYGAAMILPHAASGAIILQAGQGGLSLLYHDYPYAQPTYLQPEEQGSGWCSQETPGEVFLWCWAELGWFWHLEMCSGARKPDLTNCSFIRRDMNVPYPK